MTPLEILLVSGCVFCGLSAAAILWDMQAHPPAKEQRETEGDD